MASSFVSNTRVVAFGLALMIVVLRVPPACAGEGFGFFAKNAATVMRTTPAPIPLLGTKIGVKAASSDPANGGLAQRLAAQLESTLLSRDNRLSSNETSPETLIEVSVLQNAYSDKWESRREMASREVGKDAKGKPVYQSYEVDVRYKVVTHTLEASYKVSDRAKKSSLDAGSIRVPFDKSFREGVDAPEAFNLESLAIERVVTQIASRLTPSSERVGVLLPKGSLDDLAPLAVAGQWNKYLEALERKSPAGDPVSESYRQYALGTAYEAIGYGADTPAETLKYLEQANDFYNKALEANPKEKFFSQGYESVFGSKKAQSPLDRVRSALVNYRRIKDFKETDEARIASKEESGGKALSASAAPANEPMANAAIIRMVKAGLAQDIILGAIDAAVETHFDLSANGLIELSEAKVDRKIILHLQERASGKHPAAAKKPVKKKLPASAGGH